MGSFDASEIINSFTDLTNKDKLEQGLYLVENNINTTKLNELQKLSSFLLDLSEKENEYLIYFQISVLVTARLIKSGLMNEAKDILEHGLMIAHNYTDDDPEILSFISRLYNNYGGYYGTMGDTTNARKYFIQALEGFKLLKNQSKIAACQINISALLILEGEINEALERMMSIYEYCVSNESDVVLGNYFKNIGVIYDLKGEIEPALEYYQRSLEHKIKTKDNLEISTTLHSTAEIYKLKGQYPKAIELLEKSISLKREYNANSFSVAESLLELLKIKIIKNENKEANQIYSEIERLEGSIEDKMLMLIKDYSKAIMLKSSNRAIDKVKSQEIFEYINSVNTYNIYILNESILHLIELLIDEYKLYSEVSVLNQIIALISKVYDTAQDNHMFGYLVDSMILRAKLMTVMGQLDSALKFIDQAYFITLEKKLTGHYRKVESEREKLRNTINQMKETIKNNTIVELMEKVELSDYIKKAQQKLVEY